MELWYFSYCMAEYTQNSNIYHVIWRKKYTILERKYRLLMDHYSYNKDRGWIYTHKCMDAKYKYMNDEKI